MDHENQTSCFIGFMCGVFAMLLVDIMFLTPSHVWQKQAIDNGAAKYNETTAKFEWIKKEVKE